MFHQASEPKASRSSSSLRRHETLKDVSLLFLSTYSFIHSLTPSPEKKGQPTRHVLPKNSYNQLIKSKPCSLRAAILKPWPSLLSILSKETASQTITEQVIWPWSCHQSLQQRAVWGIGGEPGCWWGDYVALLRCVQVWQRYESTAADRQRRYLFSTLLCWVDQSAVQ